MERSYKKFVKLLCWGRHLIASFACQSTRIINLGLRRIAERWHLFAEQCIFLRSHFAFQLIKVYIRRCVVVESDLVKILLLSPPDFDLSFTFIKKWVQVALRHRGIARTGQSAENLSDRRFAIFRCIAA